MKSKKEYIHDSLDGTTWIAEVISISDDLRMGRIKASVYSKFDGLPPESIPWAIPSHSGFGGASNGVHDLPKVGSMVEVTFENGDLYSPVWRHMPFYSGAFKGKIDALEDSDYENGKFLMYDDSSKAYIYNIPSYGLVIATVSDDESGNRISILKGGSILASNEHGNKIEVAKDFIRASIGDQMSIHMTKDGIALGGDVKEAFHSMLYEMWEGFWKDTVIPNLGNVGAIPTPTGPSGTLSQSPTWNVFKTAVVSGLSKVRSAVVTIKK